MKLIVGFRILVCLVTSSFLVVVLFMFSMDTVHSHNSFLRIFPSHTLDEGDTIDIEANSFYIAGGTASNFYLGNFTAPLIVQILDSRLKTRNQVHLVIDEIEKYKFWALRLKVDSPFFQIADGAVPVVFGGDIKTWSGRRYMYDSAYFVDYSPINFREFAIRSLSSKTKGYVLGIQRADTPFVNLNLKVLEKQIDGKFCVDGMLHFDKYLNKIVYLYHYRNQFIVLDRDLNVNYKGNTIDTISHAQIQISDISSNQNQTHSKPPLLVNRRSCVFKNYLLVNSNLMAKNELRETFDESSVIDVYDLSNRTYAFSFYIPEFKGNKMRDFQVFDGILLVLFDHYAMTYKLSKKYFNQTNEEILHVEQDEGRTPVKNSRPILSTL